MHEDILKILEYGTFAPSGDNSQPWKFKIANNIVFLYLLPDADNPYLNVGYGGSLLAHGAFLENVNIAAKSFGYTVKIELFPGDFENDFLVAKLVFEKSNLILEKDELLEFIKQRHTNRMPYKNNILEKEKLDIFLQQNLFFPNINLKFFQEEKEKKFLGFFASRAEIVILENQFLHQLLFKDIVWDKKTENKRRHGLYIETMNFNPVQKFLFWLASFRPIMKLAIKINFAKFIANEDAKLYSSGAFLAGIFVAEENKESFVNAGRVMQRVWLLASKFGLGFQPLIGTNFLLKRIEDNIQNSKKEILSHEHSQLIQSAYADLYQEIPNFPKEKLQVLFRVGQAEEMKFRSSRISVLEKIC